MFEINLVKNKEKRLIILAGKAETVDIAGHVISILFIACFTSDVKLDS